MIKQENKTVPKSKGSEANEPVDIKKVIYQYMNHWYWFLLAIIIAVILAFFYNRYTTTVYNITTTMMVDPSQASSPVTGAGLSSESMFQGFGVMRSYSYYFNQMEVFVSSPLVERTIKELDFEVSYYSVGNVKTIEQYKNAPFDVVWDENHPQLLDVFFSVKVTTGWKYHHRSGR